jgi:hypothetical protein
MITVPLGLPMLIEHLTQYEINIKVEIVFIVRGALFRSAEGFHWKWEAIEDIYLEEDNEVAQQQRIIQEIWQRKN